MRGCACRSGAERGAVSPNIRSVSRATSILDVIALFLTMSGIEIAGLAFGVLPILIEAVKAYSTISKKVHTLRHYSKEVKSISEQLKVHNGIFLNEVRLLMRSIEAEEEVESMLEDAADQRWSSELLNNKLRTILRDSFEVCRSIMEETKETIEAMRAEMATFDILLDQKTKVSGPCAAPERRAICFRSLLRSDTRTAAEHLLIYDRRASHSK